MFKYYSILLCGTLILLYSISVKKMKTKERKRSLCHHNALQHIFVNLNDIVENCSAQPQGREYK